MSECSICYDNYNKSTRAKVVCFSCDYHACRECFGRYLLNTTSLTSDCPSCHKEWTREFMCNVFTQKFVNTDIKHHREELLYQRERALLPLRQIELERRKKMAELESSIKNIDEEIENLIRSRTALRATYYDIRYRNEQPTEERREFIQKCPNGDCRGFLSTQWKCGLCNMWTCSDCHEVTGATRTSVIAHACEPDKLATAKLITNETKPCPKCGVRLYKISGCNQMWCTSCNDCAFDWVTGKIEKVIHNPHYFEYQRRINNGAVPRQPGDVPCGGRHEFTAHDINAVFNNFIWSEGIHPDVKQDVNYHVRLLEEICRMRVHINVTMLPKYRYDPVRYNEDYGVSFLNGDITEQEFKVKLQRADKKMQQARETLNILDMVQTTMNDIIERYNYALSRNESDKLSARTLAGMIGKTKIDLSMFYKIISEHFKILHEIHPLIIYANECLFKVATVYGSKSPVVLKFDT